MSVILVLQPLRFGFYYVGKLHSRLRNFELVYEANR